MRRWNKVSWFQRCLEWTLPSIGRDLRSRYFAKTFFLLWYQARWAYITSTTIRSSIEMIWKHATLERSNLIFLLWLFLFFFFWNFFNVSLWPLNELASAGPEVRSAQVCPSITALLLSLFSKVSNFFSEGSAPILETTNFWKMHVHAKTPRLWQGTLVFYVSRFKSLLWASAAYMIFQPYRTMTIRYGIFAILASKHAL